MASVWSSVHRSACGFYNFRDWTPLIRTRIHEITLLLQRRGKLISRWNYHLFPRPRQSGNTRLNVNGWPLTANWIQASISRRYPACIPRCATWSTVDLSTRSFVATSLGQEIEYTFQRRLVGHRIATGGQLEMRQ